MTGTRPLPFPLPAFNRLCWLFVCLILQRLPFFQPHARAPRPRVPSTLTSKQTDLIPDAVDALIDTSNRSIPLASPLSPQQAQRMTLPIHPRSPGPASPLPRSAAQSPVPRPRVPAPRPKDFSFLLRPEIYHPLTPLTVPPAFRSDPDKQPTANTPIPSLLARGQFRAAAIAATHALTGPDAPDPSDHAKIFSLLYTRLACLTLIDATAIAAQEVKTLEDLNSVVYADEATGEHLVPWELRVLNVRLQALGFGDPRRAVMSYYDLAREARARLAAAMARHDNSARELWKDRLADVGVRVAGALVEMDDLAGAAHHLASLPAREGAGGKLAMSKALLWLHLGDVGAARKCVKAEEAGELAEKVVDALCDMADGEYKSALARWAKLKEESDDEMIGVNMAVCLLYVGRMQEVSHSWGMFAGLWLTLHRAKHCSRSLLRLAGRRTRCCSTLRRCTNFAPRRRGA